MHGEPLEVLIKTIYKAGRVLATSPTKMSGSLRLRQINGLLHHNIGIPLQYRTLPSVVSVISELEQMRTQIKSSGTKENTYGLQ